MGVFKFAPIRIARRSIAILGYSFRDRVHQWSFRSLGQSALENKIVRLLVFAVTGLWLGVYVAEAAERAVDQASERAAVQIWELRGELLSLEAGNPEMVRLRLPEGQEVMLPLAAFTDAGRAAIAGMVEERNQSAPATEPPSAAQPTNGIPEPLAADLAACRSAADGVDLCQLFMAGGSMSDPERGAVEARLQDLQERAERGDVRHGGEWVSREAAAKAAAAAAGHVTQALQMIRLGNLKLTEQELRQASRADPASGQADFLIGLACLFDGSPDYGQAADAFEEVLQREPANGAAANNLAVCNLLRRRYPTAAAGFRSAAANLPEPQAVVTNLAFVIQLAANRRSRISSTQLRDFTDLYHDLMQNRDQNPAESVAAPMILSPSGSPIVTADIRALTDIAKPSGELEAGWVATGVVVGEGIVACVMPGDGLADQAGFVIHNADHVALPAEVVATSPDRGVVLLRCEGLDAPPLPMAARSAAVKANLFVVPTKPPADPSVVVAPVVMRPTQATMVLPAAAGSRQRFIYDQKADLVVREAILTDASGQLVGLAVPQPATRRSVETRRTGLPVEAIWALLHGVDNPPTPADPAPPLALEDLQSRCGEAIVRVSPEPKAGVSR